MKKGIIIAICLVNSVMFYGQSKNHEQIKPYLNISLGYFNLHQFKSIDYVTVYKNAYSTIENKYIKMALGITNHQFKLDMYAQNLTIMQDSSMFMFGIETGGNVLNSKDFYLGPLTQIGFFRLRKDLPLMSFDNGFLINWPTFFSLGLHGGYKFIGISVYKQYAGYVANKRSWMADLSIDCLGVYRSFKKKPSD